MYNATDVTGPIMTSYRTTGSNIAASSQEIDSAKNLGYGVGKILRGAFDHLFDSLQKMRAKVPSGDEIAMRKKVTRYSQVLSRCVQRLGFDLDNLRKDPNSQSALDRVVAQVMDCTLYFKPEERKEFQAIQQKALKPLEEKISQLHQDIGNELRQLLPIVFQENNAVKPSAEKDARSAKEGVLNAKPKRALQQAGGLPASFDLTTLNGANGFKVEGLAGDELGYSVSTAGDFNGDGKADLVLGNPFADPGGRSGAGTVYVLFETNASLPSTSSPSMISRIPIAPISQPPLLTPETTVGIAVGAGVPVFLASVLTVILVLRFKKKACFADHTRTIVVTPDSRDQ